MSFFQGHILCSRQIFTNSILIGIGISLKWSLLPSDFYYCSEIILNSALVIAQYKCQSLSKILNAHMDSATKMSRVYPHSIGRVS